MKKIIVIFILLISINCFAKDTIEENSYIPKMRKVEFSLDKKIALEKIEKDIVKEYLISKNKLSFLNRINQDGTNVIFFDNKVFICDETNNYKNLFVINSKDLFNLLSKNAENFIYGNENNSKNICCLEKLIEILVTIFVEKVVDGAIVLVAEQITEYHKVVVCEPLDDSDQTDNTNGNSDDGLDADYNGGIEPGNFDSTGGFSGSGTVHRNYRIIF